MLDIWPKYLFVMSVLYHLGCFLYQISLYTQTNPSYLYVYAFTSFQHIHVLFTLVSISHPLKLNLSLQFLTGWLWVTRLTTLGLQNIIYMVVDNKHLCKVLIRMTGIRKMFNIGWLNVLSTTDSSDWEWSRLLFYHVGKGPWLWVEREYHFLSTFSALELFYFFSQWSQKGRYHHPSLHVMSLGFREHLFTLVFQRPFLWSCAIPLLYC